MAIKSPVLILAVLGATAFFLFSGKREQRFTPPATGPTALPKPITSTRPTVGVGESPPGGGISFGSRPSLPIPPIPPRTADPVEPFIGPVLPTIPTRPSIPAAPSVTTPSRPDPLDPPAVRALTSTTVVPLPGRDPIGEEQSDPLGRASGVRVGLASGSVTVQSQQPFAFRPITALEFQALQAEERQNIIDIGISLGGRAARSVAGAGRIAGQRFTRFPGADPIL